MEQNLEASIIRICNTQGQTCGTGFIVSKGLAVTCAHVVNYAREKPNEKLKIIFEASGITGEAEVLSDFWSPPEEDDAAVLSLILKNGELPQGSKSVKLGYSMFSNGHKITMLGFANLPGGYTMLWANGKSYGVVNNKGKKSMLQIDAVPIRQGMSGAPVFDLQTGRVIGMFSEFLRGERLEWATTSETICDICANIQLYPSDVVEEYEAALQKYCSTFPYITLQGISPSKNLNELYVPLKMRHQESDNKKKNEKNDEDEKNKNIPITIAEILRDQKYSRALILGEPGSGKSTLLRQIAKMAWKDPQRIGLGKPHISLLLPLRDLSETEGNIEKRISKVLAKNLTLTKEFPSGFFEDLPKQSNANWLILLDGLDEISEDKRANTLRWIREFIDINENTRIIITSRPSAFALQNSVGPRIAVFDLLSFTYAQKSEFANKWFGKQRAVIFQGELSRLRAGGFSNTPLLLTIAAKVFLENGRLPTRLTDLYDEALDIWLREASQRGLKKELGKRICKISRFILEHIALEMTSQKSSEIDHAKLGKVIEDYLHEEIGISSDEAKADSMHILQLMAVHSGVFIYRGNRYKFIHATFREFLAASMLVSKWKTDINKAWIFIEQNWSDDAWLQVVKFALEILSTEGPLIGNRGERLILRLIKYTLYIPGDSAKSFFKSAKIFMTSVAFTILLITMALNGVWQTLQILGFSLLVFSLPILVLFYMGSYYINHLVEEVIQPKLTKINDHKIDRRIPSLAILSVVRNSKHQTKIENVLSQIADNRIIELKGRIEAITALIRLGKQEQALSVLMRMFSKDKISEEELRSIILILMDEGIPEKLLAANLNPYTISMAARIFEDFSLIEEAANSWVMISRLKDADADLCRDAATELTRLGFVDEARAAWKNLIKKTRRGDDLALSAEKLESLGFQVDAAEIWQQIALVDISKLEGRVSYLRSRIIYDGNTRLGMQDDLFWEPIEKLRLESWIQKRLHAVDELKRLKQTEKLHFIAQSSEASADVRQKAEKALQQLK